LQIELSNAYPDLHSTHIFACSHFWQFSEEAQATQLPPEFILY
jgi:hypothetical protein